MKRKLEVISNRLSALGIAHQKEFFQENDNGLRQCAAYLEHINHTAFEAIEAQYSQFNPNATKEEQITFFKKILLIKNVVRELQAVHNDLAQQLRERSELYIHNEEKISVNPKNILPQLQGKEPKEIVRENFYQLLANIKKNNTLSDAQFNYITSLLMQIASRPEGINLIVKLNYLLTKNGAQLVFRNSDEFACSMTSEGNAKSKEDFANDSPDDFKSIFKRETVPGVGSKKVSVGIDYLFNDKTSSLDLDVYASPGHGLTDGGPAFILLGHELIHGVHNLNGKARDNFEPFFRSDSYKKDGLLQMLYPLKSLHSLGSAAEEYWTIEGGSLCENLLRKEHGFFNRTGHISAEAGVGGRAIFDLYHLGLSRNYSQSNLQSFVDYYAENRENISAVDKIVARALMLDKYNFLNYSLNDLINISDCISPMQATKTREAIQKLQKPSDDLQDNERFLHDFLMSAPPKVAQLLVAVLKTKDIDYSQAIELTLGERQLRALKNISVMLKEAGLPEHAVNAFEQFSNGVHEKFTAPAPQSLGL